MLIQFGQAYFYWDEEKAIKSFYESGDRKHVVIRWTAVVLSILLGAGILAANLDDLRAYEAAVREPILVQAQISVREEGWWSDSYTMYLSYTCDGVSYEGVRYLGNQNPRTRYRDGETLTVALDPRDHGQLAMKMVKTGRINCAIVMLSLGLGLAAYFFALRSDAFRRKREEKAARYSWNKGRADYILDTAMFFAPISVLVLLGLSIAFPSAYGIAPWVTAGLAALVGFMLHVIGKTFPK